MTIVDQEIQGMFELELSRLTLFSMCANRWFEKLICPDTRISSRYPIFYSSRRGKELEKTVRALDVKVKNHEDFRALVFVFAYPEEEPGINHAIRSLAEKNLIVIDATRVPMEQEINEKYALNMVYFDCAETGHDPEAERFRERAYEELRAWTDRVLYSGVTVYDREHPDGIEQESLKQYYTVILEEIERTFPLSPDTMDLDDAFYLRIGARFYVRDGYYGKRISEWRNGDTERVPDRLFVFAWGRDDAWDDPAYANETIVILKKAFDGYIEEQLQKGKRVSFADIFSFMRKPPYGLLPNVIGAILVGMFFRTWKNRGLVWTNGFQQDALDDSHILTLAGNGIHNQHTFHPNALVDYIMRPDERILHLREAANHIFSMDEAGDLYLSDLRSGMRHALEALQYPVVSVRHEEIGEKERTFTEALIRFVRMTSDGGDQEDEESLITEMNAALAADSTLAERMREALDGENLKKGFAGMLRKHGIDPVLVPEERIARLCGGHSEWKWIWREESVIQGIRSFERDEGDEPDGQKQTE